MEVQCLLMAELRAVHDCVTDFVFTYIDGIGQRHHAAPCLKRQLDAITDVTIVSTVGVPDWIHYNLCETIGRITNASI